MAGKFYFCGLVLLLSTLGLLEFYALVRAKGAHPQTGTGVVFGILVSAGFIYARVRDLILTLLDRAGISLPFPSMAQYFLILALLFVPLLFAVELFRNRGSAVMNMAVTALGGAYVSLFFGSLIGIRELFIPEDFPVFAHFAVPGVAVSDDVAATVYQWGGLTVLVFFASIWLCDSAAYFAGRAFGRHKLFERVSPNKTWEGAVAGLLFAVAAFVLGKVLLLPYLTIAQAATCGGIVGVFGQLGDLSESLLKRDAGVKDSSRLIPGHGGILDRFDSILYASPLLYFYLDFVVF
jgi:phosphatidate cytidylyltransferase